MEITDKNKAVKLLENHWKNLIHVSKNLCSDKNVIYVLLKHK